MINFNNIYYIINSPFCSHCRGYTCIILAQIGLGSPELLYKSITLKLQQQILYLMSAVLTAASPAKISRYEEKEGLEWGTFLPYMKFLYTPTTVFDKPAKNRSNAELDTVDPEDTFRTDFHILCCNILLYGLENALGREIHFQILIKEGLLDYSMCLPAVLPQECKPRARSLVSELRKHRQLQPVSLCTLAKAHIAKSFCGIETVMEMHSVEELYRNCF